MRLAGLSEEQTKEIVPENTFLLGYRGSIAHGMYVPNSDPNSIDDKDIMGVCFGPISSYCGFGKFEQQEKFYNEWDSVVYEVRKFVRLLTKANPNVLSLLWLDAGNYIYKNAIGDALVANRELFITKEIYYSFTGYAFAQLKKMTHGSFNGYMGDKRKKLVEKFGYDTKNAAHLIRLLRMGIEFLNDRHLNVKRHDAPQLLEIKMGGWTLERVQREADSLFKLAEETFTKCTFPRFPDYQKIDSFLTDIVRDFISRKP